MSKITLSSVTKKYSDDVIAVSNIDLQIESGEFVTIVGPSGCGKTTTLRTIAGFEVPTDGEVMIKGEEVTGTPAYERDTGMVFQDFALFPHLTVRKNIAYGMEVQGKYTEKEIDARVKEMLELIELPNVGGRKPTELSGGQQQRIALARALAPEPDALLLDEPLASLDKKLREQMQVELRRIQEEVEITTVLVTHNQEEALTMSDRIAVMNDGQIEQVGEPEKVYNNPKSRFVANFLGTANVFEGVVRTSNNGSVFIDCDDTTLRVEHRAAKFNGDSAVVVRPERVVLEQMSSGGKTLDENSFRGVVRFKRHLGSSVEYQIETTSGRTLTAVRRSGVNAHAVGDSVVVSIPPDSCRIVEG